jgi:hypothetical protein
VPNNGNSNSLASLSMIDITDSNGDDTGGCAGQTPPATPIPRGATSATLDPFTGTLNVAAFNNASEALVDTTRATPACAPAARPYDRWRWSTADPFIQDWIPRTTRSTCPTSSTAPYRSLERATDAPADETVFDN